MSSKAKKSNRIIWLVIAILIVIFLFRLDNPFLQAQEAGSSKDQWEVKVVDSIDDLINNAEIITLPGIPPYALLKINVKEGGGDKIIEKVIRIDIDDLKKLEKGDHTIIKDILKEYYGESYATTVVFAQPPITKPSPEPRRTAKQLIEDFLKDSKDRPVTKPKPAPQPPVVVPDKPQAQKPKPAPQPPVVVPALEKPIPPAKPGFGITRKGVIFVTPESYNVIERDLPNWRHYLDVYLYSRVSGKAFKDSQNIYNRAKEFNDIYKEKMKRYEAAMRKYREDLKKYNKEPGTTVPMPEPGSVEDIVGPKGGYSIIDSMNPLPKK